MFTIGISKSRKLNKKEKVKRLLKKSVYNVNTFPPLLSLPFITLPIVTLPFVALPLVTPPLVTVSNFLKQESWRIPQAILVSSSIRYKFTTLSFIFSYNKIVECIKDSIRRVRFKFSYQKETFNVSKEIKSQISSYYSKEENEWNKVRGIYLKLFRFKKYITPLIYNWKIKITRRNIKNVEDPVTMEIPKKPVHIIDIKKRISFVYDAKSLRRAIEARLLFSDYMFAEPLDPVNLLTNESLTYGQLISICKQCKEYGETSWVLEEFMNHGSNLKRFAIFNKQRLNLEAINVFFRKGNHVIRETVIDFFLIEADMVDMPRYKITGFMRRYDIDPKNALVQKWIKNTREYYIAKELNDPTMLQKNDIDTEKLLNEIHLSIF
jgi:hypothetical protein